MSDSYDMIVIGSGAGGGTLVCHLAQSGKRILLLERGAWLPCMPQNWLAQDRRPRHMGRFRLACPVFVVGPYVSPARCLLRLGSSGYRKPPPPRRLWGGPAKQSSMTATPRAQFGQYRSSGCRAPGDRF